jgi:2-polyprenyl-3-methyl-5-hydroxy-6-metoxy-1,4-benzoquinol methylase
VAEVGVDGGWQASARRWVELIDAGEPHRELLLDPVVLELCGEVRGLRVLDLGCGEGRFSRLVARRGACSIGVDRTSLLIAAAGERHPDGRYVRAAAEASRSLRRRSTSSLATSR